jgi:ubiquinone/menaquinone biosynthesis C-methylase UbiE
VAAIGLHPAARVLEVGSGPGFFSPFIAASTPDGSAVILDLQPEMLHLARERVGPRDGVGFVDADAQCLPFCASSFDAAFIATVLGEVLDGDSCLAELRRVLRPGGIATFSETRRDSDFIPLGKLRQEVECHSFSFLDRRGMPWQYVARFRAS